MKGAKDFGIFKSILIVLIWYISYSIIYLFLAKHLQPYLGSLISKTLSYLIVFIVILRIFLQHDKRVFLQINRVPAYYIFYIVFFAIFIKLLQDPFFRFNAIFGKNDINIDKLIEIAYLRQNTTNIWQILSALVISPIATEMIFRGYIFRGISYKSGVFPAIFISSLLYSIIHIPAWNNLMPTFIFGLFSA